LLIVEHNSILTKESFNREVFSSNNKLKTSKEITLKKTTLKGEKGAPLGEYLAR